jgi:hypothetical protein
MKQCWTCSGKAKVILPEGIKEGLTESQECFPHISTMMAHSTCGVALPPFVILEKLALLPPDLKPFDQSGQMWFASTSKGWQSRGSFRFWSIHFVNFLNSYRTKLPTSIRFSRGLLFSDGHPSSGYPSAIQSLENLQISIC